MKTYYFQKFDNSKVEIIISARNYTEVMDIMLSIVRNFDEFTLIKTRTE